MNVSLEILSQQVIKLWQCLLLFLDFIYYLVVEKCPSGARVGISSVPLRWCCGQHVSSGVCMVRHRDLLGSHRGDILVCGPCEEPSLGWTPHLGCSWQGSWAGGLTVCCEPGEGIMQKDGCGGTRPVVPHRRRWEEIVTEIVQGSSLSQRECSCIAHIHACKGTSWAGIGHIGAGSGSNFCQPSLWSLFLFCSMVKNTVKLETSLNAFTCVVCMFALLGAGSLQVSFIYKQLSHMNHAN